MLPLYITLGIWFIFMHKSSQDVQMNNDIAAYWKAQVQIDSIETLSVAFSLISLKGGNNYNLIFHLPMLTFLDYSRFC